MEGLEHQNGVIEESKEVPPKAPQLPSEVSKEDRLEVLLLQEQVLRLKVEIEKKELEIDKLQGEQAAKIREYEQISRLSREKEKSVRVLYQMAPGDDFQRSTGRIIRAEKNDH